jgi:hypothetical protein
LSLPEPFASLGDNQVNAHSLVQQLRTGGVFPFVGAGLSVPFGFPDWKTFLLSRASGETTRARVQECLDRGEYEEAAQILFDEYGSNSFQDAVEFTFGPGALKGELPSEAAVLRLPDLCAGPVVTTNFDIVLERVFEQANRPFTHVLAGMRVDTLSKAIHQDQQVLIHLHGTAEDRTDRVFTLGDYRKHYESDQPLEAVLRLLMVRPILFLGCSLNGDRPVRILQAFAEELRSRRAEGILRHYAVLEYPADVDARQRRRDGLERMGVRPIWYPTGRHDLIRDLLGYLAEESGEGAPLGMVERYAEALLASFRLDGSGLAVKGASRHALALAQAYAGTRYLVNNERLTLSELIGTRRRLVLLGEPGSGKSVTLKRLLAESARRGRRLPVYLRLADFAAEQAARREIPAARLVEAFAESARDLGIPGLDARALERALSGGQAIVALDGFDEIGGKAARERVARAIGQLSDAAPGIVLIVASRPAEYEDTPLPAPTGSGTDRYVTATTLPLDTEQVREFLGACFGDDGRLWNAIRRSDELSELARTPLRLTLLGLLGQQGPLPADRAGLYRAVVKTAIESWEEDKREAGPSAADGKSSTAAARRALEDLALAMHQRETPAAPLPEGRALDAIGGDATLLDWLVQRAGLLKRHEQRGANSVRAVVQLEPLPLQEYLTGCALAHRIKDDDRQGRALLARWGGESTWAEPQRFAAAVLAPDAPEALESWVASRLPAGARRAKDPQATLLGASLLAQADAEFLPAPKIAARVVQALGALDASEHALTRVRALCALAPRPAALQAVREIALQTRKGLRWLGRRHALPADSLREESEELLAACIRIVWAHGEASDAQAAVRWLVVNAPRLWAKAQWARCAPAVEGIYDVERSRAFLRDLALAGAWPHGGADTGVPEFLNVVALADHVELARALAAEGSRGHIAHPVTAGFARWLETQGDEEALEIADRYYGRLRQWVARLGADVDWSANWHELPLWPARHSAATDALRREVLRHRHSAWYVIREAIHSPYYRDEARGAWLSIVSEDPDQSRRNGLVFDMIHEPDAELAVPLLMEALRFAGVDLWFGERIVRNLTRRGHGTEALDRLATVLRDEATLPAQHATVQRLLEKLRAPDARN